MAGGQILSGEEARSSVGNTTIAKSVVCVVAFLGYLLTVDINWMPAVATAAGAVAAAPFAASTVKKVRGKHLKSAIGLAMITLGIATLLKVR